ncbi:flagellar protein FlaG [Herbaspirillum seropedicae]|uniref:Flagellin protein n=2 Tax=Herbaspirillum seropedicae TaxID=964 RepID=D8IT10_HERSS|nr:flagellar protein FlaG [Herbaspirillum seropedicae]ADJ63569.1 flagellin protein [Herbaspirillum seropedicae SmR1]AKN65597.1 flagellin [Herbaspirillum seropedicae]AON54396.1 flagellin protein [Herbaspirillum seropedicae]MDR6394556.1 flagellar protein FlaG [Herbaspirillum seropedicae]NQE28756.1 flagellin [Herbaspirillum seropedicae]
MSIAPLNIASAADSGTAYALPKTAAKPDPVVSTVAPVAAPDARRATDSEVNDAVSKLNDFAASNAAALNFSKDEDTGKTIVKVMDTATDTVIRQIPSEEAIAIAKSIDKMQGLLINHKA